MTPTRWSLRVFCLLVFATRLAAMRYGDYAAGRMPQYAGQPEDGDVAPSGDDYSDRSPDAPARLDYKYEEDPHGRSDDLPVKDVIDERIWDKPVKKKRKPSVSRSNPHRGVDKYSLEDAEPELKSDKRFIMHGSEFRKRDYVRLSDPERRSKQSAVDQSSDIENAEINHEYVHRRGGEADGEDAVEASHVRYRATAARKPRRKPRDRALRPPDWRDRSDARSGKDDLEIETARRFRGVIAQDDVNRKSKNNYDYNEYYDMKRVQHAKNRLPALLRRTTVRTTEAKSTGRSGHWVNRRADSAAAGVAVSAGSAPPSTLSTAPSPAPSTPSTPRAAPTAGEPADLSLAEKSRLSILKKAQRKEVSRNVSASTKPPVLMQVTRRMQTMVMVEPRPSEPALRARQAPEDSPERLQRARRLMRHKLVAGARSIQELTDDWDQMVCDYIDVSLLDADSAPPPPAVVVSLALLVGGLPNLYHLYWPI